MKIRPIFFQNKLLRISNILPNIDMKLLHICNKGYFLNFLEAMKIPKAMENNTKRFFDEQTLSDITVMLETFQNNFLKHLLF